MQVLNFDRVGKFSCVFSILSYPLLSLNDVFTLFLSRRPMQRLLTVATRASAWGTNRTRRAISAPAHSLASSARRVDVRLHRGRHHRRLRRLHQHPRPPHLDDLRPRQQDQEILSGEDPRRGHQPERLSGSKVKTVYKITWSKMKLAI